MDKKPVLLIDGSNYLFRFFFGMPRLINSQGLPTSIIYGFARMLIKLFRDYDPEYVVVAMDPRGPTFRNELYPQYKANRDETPDDIVTQYPYVVELIEAFGVPVVVKENYEADDVIGTLARAAEKEGRFCYVIASDKDMLQLVSKSVHVMDPVKEEVLGPQEVRERFGVDVDKVIDLMALSGDAADNIPGAPGIGPKTAAKLINQYGTLEEVMKHASEVGGKRAREGLLAIGDDIYLSRKLVTIESGVPLDKSLADLAVGEKDDKKLEELLLRFEFRTLLEEIYAPQKAGDTVYQCVDSIDKLEDLIGLLKSAPVVSVDTETTHLLPMWAELVGISFSVKEQEGYYIPLAHRGLDSPAQLDRALVIDRLRPLLEDTSIKKVGQNIKYDIIVLRQHGIDLKGVVFDVMLGSHLTSPDRRSHSLDNLARDYLNHKMISFSDVVNKKSGRDDFADVPLDQATEYAAEDADIALRLYNIIVEKVREQGLEELYYEVEQPLIYVLARVEENGVLVDRGQLDLLSGEFNDKMQSLQEQIFEAAGSTFNVNSSQQLAQVLFKDIKLPPGKKTKTGYSTDVKTLEGLRKYHTLPGFILEYRSLAKLKSTYVDTLPGLINPRTGRIHTSFNQAVTATGRLSSSDPNMQNIPVRTPEGRRIREAFVAPPGKSLICADYSQIELRLLAHLSGDSALLEAFREGKDIHSSTAAQVFDLPEEFITPEMRRMAKVINFGIIYGMGAFRLAGELNISRAKAKEFIENYFEHYSGVREFIEKNLKDCEERGFVKTLLGRRRNLPELKSSNKMIHAQGERLAINTPVQGTAADLIKLAMIKIDRLLQHEQTRMILQVHDELIFETPEEEVEKIAALVKKEMEGAYPLSVPLVVDVDRGSNWADAH